VECKAIQYGTTKVMTVGDLLLALGPHIQMHDKNNYIGTRSKAYVVNKWRKAEGISQRTVIVYSEEDYHIIT